MQATSMLALDYFHIDRAVTLRDDGGQRPMSAYCTEMGVQVTPLARAYGQARIETGMIIMQARATRLFGSGPATRSELSWLKAVAYHHELIHYLQSITCAAVYDAAHLVLALGVEILGTGANPSQELSDRFRAAVERIYGRRWKGGDERVRIFDEPGSTLIVPLNVPEHHKLSMADLIEGVAVVESFKLCTADDTVHDFLRFRDDHFPGDVRNLYRWSFNWLGGDVGAAAAYELLAPVTYISLQRTDPAKAFVELAALLKGQDDPHQFTDPARLLELAGWTDSPGVVPAGHPTLDPAVAAAVEGVGAAELARLGAHPGSLQAEHTAVLSPPMIAFGGDGAVQFLRAPYTDDKLAADVLSYTAVVGAAERLILDVDAEVHQFCPHRHDCPHYYSALCHRYLRPPRDDMSWQSCGFIDIFRQGTGAEPAAVWEAAGRGRLTAAELVEAFESVGEADIVALCRRQRRSIVAWLGEEDYRRIADQCEMVGDQVLLALRTQKMQDAIQAQMYRNAVVDQIRKLAAQ